MVAITVQKFLILIKYFVEVNLGISPTAGGGGLGLGRGGLELKLHEVPTTDSSQVRRVQVQVHRGEAEVYLNLDEAYLS